MHSILLGLLFLCPFSFADLGDGAHAIIQSLENKKISSVGDLDLSDLNRRMNGIHWSPKRSYGSPSFAGDRETAYFEVSTKNVHVLASLPDFTKPYSPTLELHEALGALEFND